MATGDISGVNLGVKIKIGIKTKTKIRRMLEESSRSLNGWSRGYDQNAL